MGNIAPATEELPWQSRVGRIANLRSFDASALRLMARTAIELHRIGQCLSLFGVPRPIGFRDLTERPNGLMIAVARHAGRHVQVMRKLGELELSRNLPWRRRAKFGIAE